MLQLLNENVVNDCHDFLVHDLVESYPAEDVMFTRPGIMYEPDVNPEALAYTIDHYYRKLRKKLIVFSDHKEAPNAKFLKLMAGTVKLLTEKYEMSIDCMLYTTGFINVKNNLENLIELLDTKLIPIKILNPMYFEREWSFIVEKLSYNIDGLHSRQLRNKNFLYFTGSLRPHRLLMLAKLIESSIINKTHYSILTDKTVIDQQLCSLIHYHQNKEIPENKIEKCRDIIKKYPVNFPKLLSSKMGDHENQHRLSEQDIYYFSDSYVSIIPETTFYKNNNIDLDRYVWNFHLDFTLASEKTFRAIAALHPFIIMSRPHTLTALKEIGYKTFHPYIDETYDEIEDDDLRLEKIFESIAKLSSNTNQDWLEFQKNIYPIVLHNYDILYKARSRKVTLYDV